MVKKTKDIIQGDMNPWLNLANAIIIQAVQDYEDVLKNWKVYRPVYNTSRDWGRHFGESGNRLMLEEFFRSDYFRGLSRGAVDGELVIQHVKAKISLGNIKISDDR